LELRHVSSPVGFEDQVAIDDHPDWKSGPDCQRGLNIEVTAHHLLSCLVQGIRRAQSQRLKNAGIVAAVCPRAEFGSYAKAGRQPRWLESLGPLIVELVAKTGLARGVRSFLPLQSDRATIRHDQARPHQERSRLPKRDLAVIDSDQACSLRNEFGSAGWAVKNILGDLRGLLDRFCH